MDSITPNDYSGLGIPDLPIEEVDPAACQPSKWNAEVYGRLLDGDESAGQEPLYASGDSIEALTDSIRRARGNIEPALLLDSGNGSYQIITGHRRARACNEAGLLLSARVLPADVPEDVVLKIGIESNATQRVRSPIQILREARLQEPRIRAMLDARKKGGRKQARNITFNSYVAEQFFGGRVSASTVDNLIQVVRLAEGDMNSRLYRKAVEAAPKNPPTAEREKPGRGLAGEVKRPPDPVKESVEAVVKEARGYVVLIDKDEMSPGEAYKKLDKTPVERRRKQAASKKKRQQEQEASQRLHTVTSQVARLTEVLAEMLPSKTDPAKVEAFFRALTPIDPLRLHLALPSLVHELNTLRKMLGDGPPSSEPEDENKPKRRSVKDSLMHPDNLPEPDPDPRNPWVQGEPTDEPKATEPKATEPQATEPNGDEQVELPDL